MINDLFSHKIHSSGDEWPEKLSELASIFGEFDGQLYDRDAFENRLQSISPRTSYLASSAISTAGIGERLDVSKFRDEISAYPAYLGLYCLERSPAGWVVRVSKTAKRFLLNEEPDIASFLRLQLPLFQYPNAMGAAYYSYTNKLRIQPNARNRSLGFIGEGVHFSPVRLISVALKADALLRDVGLQDSSVSFTEIFCLANTPGVYRTALPEIGLLTDLLRQVRNGQISGPERFESRFHTLRHTEIFILERGQVKLRPSVNALDSAQLVQQVEAIASIDIQFDGFDDCRTGSDLEAVIGGGAWGRYFDGVEVLPSSIVDILTGDKVLETASRVRPGERVGVLPEPVAETYPFRERTTFPAPPRVFDRSRELADPEITRIKRQKRNLIHKELIDKMDLFLRSIGANPQENDHIDLFAKIPTNGSFIFEMKSGGVSLLDQIRKGVSQLYEYRYRYSGSIADDHISLCLVLSESPDSIPWIKDYLCVDRDINLCWFNDAGEPEWPSLCAESMEVFTPTSS
jgi:hypothetical protein